MQNGAGTCVKKWHKIDTRGSTFVHANSTQKKTAGEFSSHTSGQSKLENVSKGDSSIVSADNAIILAAKWYLTIKDNYVGNFTSKIMKKFGLKLKQFVEAYRLAEQLSKEVRHG